MLTKEIKGYFVKNKEGNYLTMMFGDGPYYYFVPFSEITENDMFLTDKDLSDKYFGNGFTDDSTGIFYHIDELTTVPVTLTITLHE